VSSHETNHSHHRCHRHDGQHCHQDASEECLNGVFSGSNDLVEKLTGQKPLEMTDYILKNKAMFS
jgi:hypothetical protein